MNIKNHLLEQPFIFNLWQLPFAHQKLIQLFKHANMDQARSVLDIGCGPGTNALHFARAEYLGIDINEKYIQMARKRYPREFLVADVTSSQAIPPRAYDLILVNSFLHHLDTPTALRVLSSAGELLSEDGYLHSVELVLPEKRGIARWLTVHDRGKFPRSLSSWREIFEQYLQPAVFEPFPIRYLGQTILELVYFKGRKKQ
jgi:SAM-dependent methyltransferase